MLLALALAAAETPAPSALHPDLAAYEQAVEAATAAVTKAVPRMRACQNPPARQLVVKLDLVKGVATTAAIGSAGAAKVAAPCLEQAVRDALTKPRPAVGLEAVVVLDASEGLRLDGDVALLGALSNDAVETGMRNVVDLVAQCYVVGLAEAPGLTGQVVVNFTVLPHGTVAKPEIKRTELWNPTVETCVLQQVARAQFPRPDGGAIARVTYPFTFNPP